MTVKAKEVKPATIEFDAVPSADKTVVGGKYTLFVTVMPSNATNQNVLFASSDETVAKVDENGRITFLKAGKVTITATAEADSSVKKSIELTVTGGENPAESGSGSTGTSTGKKGCGGALRARGFGGGCYSEEEQKVIFNGKGALRGAFRPMCAFFKTNFLTVR